MAIGEQTPLLLRSKRRDHNDSGIFVAESDVIHRGDNDSRSGQRHECSFGTNPDSGVWLTNSDPSETLLVVFIWAAMIGSVSYTLHHCTHTVIGLLLATTSVLSLACHAKAALTDPGSVPQNIVITGPHKKRMPTFCSICQATKPPLAHHCRICQRCISRMDHHCPWIHNCVGAGNMKHFCLFLVYTLVSGALMLYESLGFPSPLAIGLAWLFVVPVLSFVSYVLWNMFDNIQSGIGSIDRLQGVTARQQRLRCMPDVMGTNWMVAWLPVDPVLQDPARVLHYTTAAGETGNSSNSNILHQSFSSQSPRRRPLTMHNMDVLDV